MTEGPGMVPCECNNHPTAASVSILAKDGSSETNNSKIRRKKQGRRSAKTEKKTERAANATASKKKGEGF